MSATKTKERKPKKQGKLIVIEGIDGAGKTTVIRKLTKRLKSKGHKVSVSEWRESLVIGGYLKKLVKEKIKLCPHAFSTLHAADFADRVAKEIKPALARGEIVICDRYFYTEIVRDAGLKMECNWSEGLFPFAPNPDLIIYLDISLGTSLARVRKRIKKNGKPGSLNKTLQNTTGSLIGSLDSTTGIMINSKYTEDGDPMTDIEREKIKFGFQLITRNKYDELFAKQQNVARINGEKERDTVLAHALAAMKSVL
jgi:dTMP kinase